MPDAHDEHPAVGWLVDLDVAPRVELPGGDVVDRDTFLGWLWAIADDAGLLGISEGSIDVAEAAALGFAASSLVLDAAAAPAGRDWVGRRAAARVVCGFASAAAARDVAARLAPLSGCRVVAVRAEAIPDEVAWRSAFGPVAVAGFGTVLPAWEPGAAGTGAEGTTIFIEPGVGFGTGLHETTRLCLAALSACRPAGGPFDRVLDFGAGSGILGIAAAVLGTRQVDAVESDTTVHGAIRANAARNGVADRVRIGAGLPAVGSGYDLVLANIVAPVLLDQAERLCRAVRRDAAGAPAGGLVLCGVRDTEADEVAARYGGLLGAGPGVAALGEWRCLRFG